MTIPNFYRLETANADLSSYNEFIETPLDNTGGALHLTEKPGLGVEMNMDYLSAHKIEL